LETPYILLVDGGSTITRREFSRELVDATSLKIMVDMGYAATTIGAHDLYMGLEYFKTVFGESGLPVVSANVYDESTGELLVQPYIVVERAGVRFAITGVLDPGIDLRTHREVEGVGVTVSDPFVALSELIPALREKADHVILLSHMGLARSKDVAAEVPGIDILVVGNHSAYSADPFEIAGVLFVQPGYKGQYFSDYRLTYDDGAVYTGYTGKSFALDDKIPSDAAVALALKEHKLAVEGATKDAAAERARDRETSKRTAEGYAEACLGVNDSCKRCHQPQYDQWLTTAHANAFDTLEEAHQSTNPACLTCHTSCQLELPLDGSVAVDVAMRSVQCESCHGIGTDHARDGSYGAIRKEACLACHDEENSPEFDYDAYVSTVTH
jgi:hypothetical protein